MKALRFVPRGEIDQTARLAKPKELQKATSQLRTMVVDMHRVLAQSESQSDRIGATTRSKYFRARAEDPDC